MKLWQMFLLGLGVLAVNAAIFAGLVWVATYIIKAVWGS